MNANRDVLDRLEWPAERLYPSLRGERLDRIMEQFADLERAGRRPGPVRPSD